MIQIVDHSSAERYAEERAAVASSVPAGHFAAVADGTIIAQAETHAQLVAVLQAQGRSPKDLVILQAGVEYPKSAVIF